MVLPAVQETGVQSLGWEDPMEEGMATHCSISWETPWARSLSGYSSWGCKESDVTVWLTQTCTWACVHSHTCTHTHTHTQSLIRKPIPETIIWPTSQGDWFVNVKSSWDVYLQVYYFLIFWSSLVFKKFCPFHHVREYLLSTWLTKGDISLDHLVNIMSARFLQCKSNIFLPFLYSNPYQWVTKSNLPWRGRKLNSTFWQEDIYVYYLDFFCKDLSVFTCLCIYLASQLVQW